MRPAAPRPFVPRTAFEHLKGIGSVGELLRRKLGGSWVVITRVISRVTILITHIRGLITLLITTPEPPSKN